MSAFSGFMKEELPNKTELCESCKKVPPTQFFYDCDWWVCDACFNHLCEGSFRYDEWD